MSNIENDFQEAGIVLCKNCEHKTNNDRCDAGKEEVPDYVHGGTRTEWINRNGYGHDYAPFCEYENKNGKCTQFKQKIEEPIAKKSRFRWLLGVLGL